ncbi:hypothetical protein ACFE04_009440 [Oxalis oulophora]
METRDQVAVRVFKWNQALLENVVPPSKEIFIRDMLDNTFSYKLEDRSIGFLGSMIYNKIVGNYVFDIENLLCASEKIVIVVEINRGIVPASWVLDEKEKASWMDIWNIDPDYEEIDWESLDAIRILHERWIVAYLMDFLNLSHDHEGLHTEGKGFCMIPSLSMFEIVRIEESKLTSKENDKSKDNNICAICFEDLSFVGKRGTCRKMTCSHVFHGDCFARWLWKKWSCPMCQTHLPAKFPEKFY